LLRAHAANSHSGIGWQLFTDKVIKTISTKANKGVVFLLWGAFAKKKGELIDPKKHVIIKVSCSFRDDYPLDSISFPLERSSVPVELPPLLWLPMFH